MVLAGDQALGDRELELAGLVAQRLAAVAEQRARRHRGGVQLARVRAAGADGVDVGTGGQPVPAQHRLAGAGGGHHDVGAGQRLLRAGHDGDHGRPQAASSASSASAARSASASRRAWASGRRVDAHLLERANRRQRLQVGPGLGAGAEDGQHPRLAPGQDLRRDRGHRRGAPLGDRRGVEYRGRLPGLAVEQRDDPLVRVQAARRVARHDAHRLEAERRGAAGVRPAPARHQPHEPGRLRRDHHRPQRQVGLAARPRGEHLRHRLGARGGGQRRQRCRDGSGPALSSAHQLLDRRAFLAGQRVRQCLGGPAPGARGGRGR